MKRLFALALLIAGFAMLSTANADSPRKVLFQHFTGASCGPCASVAPLYYGYIKENLDKIIPLSFHVPIPGYDLMYEQWKDSYDVVGAYYAIGSAPRLIVAGNKWEGHPGTFVNDNSSIATTLAAQSSQFTITVEKSQNGQKNDVVVTVHSSKKVLNPTTLRVAVAEAYHYYENAGNNGEKDFYYIPRTMLPTAQGTIISKFEANETKTFNMSFNDNPEWYPSVIYVVAWLQNNSDKEVYQAASTPLPNMEDIESTPKVSLNITSLTPYNKVAESETVKKTITVSNPNSFQVKAGVYINTTSSSIPEDWSASINKSELTLPAGGSEDVEVSVTAGYSAELASVVVAVAPQNLSGAFAISKEYKQYFLSSAVKYALFNTNTSYGAPVFYPMQLNTTDYGANLAVIPFTEEVTTAYPPENFDVAIFNTRSPLGQIVWPTQPQVNYIKAMQNAGKHVIITADAIGAAISHPDVAPATKTYLQDFLTNVAQVNYAATAARATTTDGQNYTINTFSVNGVDKDTITAAFSATYNNLSLGGSLIYTQFTENFTIPSGSPATPIAFYDGNPSRVGAIRLENLNGSKLVYAGFPIEVTSAQNMVKTFLNNTFKWMVGYEEVFNPEIVTDYENLVFGQIVIGQVKDTTLEILNYGTADLKITKLEIVDDDDSVFTILDNEPRTVAPDGSTIYHLRFAPKEEKLYTFVKLRIFNNDPTAKNFNIAMQGIGLLPQATGPRVKINTDSLKFGTVKAADVTVDRELTINNTGIANLVLTDLRIDNDFSNSFSIVSLPPDPIAPGANFKVRVRFYPPVEGDFSAVLKFTTNDEFKPYCDIQLVGTATHNISVSDGLFGNDFFTMSSGPNPFATTTNLKFNIDGYSNQDVKISLLDATGKEVALIVNGTVAPGEHNISFDGSFLSSGSYFVVAKVGNYSTTMPVAIVK